LDGRTEPGEPLAQLFRNQRVVFGDQDPKA
jgi:hypothetical protein